jgi:hypothetical protein
MGIVTIACFSDCFSEFSLDGFWMSETSTFLSLLILDEIHFGARLLVSVTFSLAIGILTI